MFRRFAFAAVAAGFFSTSAYAESGPNTLEALFAPLSQGACVKIDEVRAVSATVQLTPDQSPAANYAFDVTPARLVTGLITERGVLAASRTALAGAFPERAG